MQGRFNRCFKYLVLELLISTIIEDCCIQGQNINLSSSPSTVVLGNSVRLTCSVSNFTVQSEPISFRRGSTTVCTTVNCTQSQNITGYSCGCTGGTQTYHTQIESAAKADGGTNNWVCSIGGVTSNGVSLTVHYSPTISSVPNSKDVRENTAPNINCSSNITPGNPSSTSYRWTGPGSYSKTGAVLDRTVTKSQGGQYTCTANNTAGLSDTAQVNINVQYPPTVTSVPSSKDVRENTAPNINCSSNITPGNPSSTSYRWTGPGGYSKTGAVLDRTVTKSQGGQYTCTANNTAGLSDTAQVNINVQYPPSITSMPSSRNVTENTHPNIACSSYLTPGNPSPTTYRWTGPGGYNKTSALLDRTVTRSHRGLYTCIASNTVGSDTAQVNISVQYLDKPSLTISPPQVKENSSVRLNCNVVSYPTVQMTIRNVDNSLTLVNKEGTNSRQYVIGKVQCLHNGTYQCIADTGQILATETNSASLNVLCSPRWDTRKSFRKQYIARVKTTVSMETYIISNPLPSFTWGRYDDGKLEPIDDSTRYQVNGTGLKSVLQINIYQSRDYGMYAVRVVNSIGSVILQFELTSRSQPFPPTEIESEVTGERSLSISWLSMYNGGAEQAFHIEYQGLESDVRHQIQTAIPDPGRHQTVTQNITELETNTTYIFYLYSTNIYGRSGTVVFNTSTDPAIKLEPESREGVITALGVSLGLCLCLLVLASGFAFLIRRELKAQTKHQVPDQNPYSGLQQSAAQGGAYDQLHMKPKQDTDPYVNVQVSKPKATAPIYENHSSFPKSDSAHSGTSKHKDTHQHEDSNIYANQKVIEKCKKRKKNTPDSRV